MSRLLCALMMVMILPATVLAAVDSIIVTDASLTGNQTWSPDSAGFYLLTELCFVDAGDTLTIMPGTVIKGEPGQGDSASALVVARKGYLYANGTAAQPIIFTAQADDVNDLNDLPEKIRGLWGGVILLGIAGTNVAGDSNHIEGIPTTEPRGVYGPGSAYTRDDHDNSGVLRYISIRYGGSILGLDNEINGLTFGAVGDGTTIEYIETFNNADDGYEFFGGTVNTKHMISTMNDDDGFDYDEGYRGKNQFWFVYQDSLDGNTGGEHDGGTVPEDGMPYAIPVISNATYIGAGSSSFNVGNDMALNFRDNAGGKYYNSIFTEFYGFGVQIEDLVSGEDSRARLEAGDLELQHNMFWDFGAGGTSTDLFPQAFVETYMTDGTNDDVIGDPQFAGPPPATRRPDGTFDPRPTLASPAASGATVPADPFFDSVSYKGAFEPGGNNWARGWTALDQFGYFTPGPVDSIIVTDVSLTGNQTWSPDSAAFYLLTELCFVDAGDTLTIMPGTVIKGEPGQGDSASALIVARKGYINADGTAAQPIIFTAQADDVNDPNDLPAKIRGLWGGVILLGIAGTNVAGDSNHIEGIPTTEPRGVYGPGSAYTRDDHDNTGIMRYISIRYGGSILGLDNEINGLTFGAVGDGTTIEHIETFNNADDGYEFFGGTVNTRYMISAFNDDDGFDYDEGYRGKNQFWFVYQDSLDGNTGGEHDGGTVPEDGMPYAIPVISNATYIGAGSSSFNVGNDMALNFRDNAGGKYYNSIFTEFFGFGVQIEDLVSGEDSRARLEAGDLELQHNMFWDFGAGSTSTDLFPQAFVETYMTDGTNDDVIGDPQFAGPPPATRRADALFDPRPTLASPAASGATVPADPFFTNVSYKGAFEPGGDNWATGWTALDYFGYFGTAASCLISLSGDVNVNGAVTSSDIIYMVGYVFKGGPAPMPCPASGDVNCNGSVTSSDIIYMVGYVFKGGPAPCDVCNDSPMSCP